jgi:hypothetical protein
MRVQVSPPTKPPPSKSLPRAFRQVTVAYDYGIVKFRNRNEGYRAKKQTFDCDLVQVGTLDAQVRIHCFIYGADKRSGKSETVDVDFYLPVAEFRKVSDLIRGVHFKRDRQGVLRVKKWRRKSSTR